jgi:hypothetical protein
MARGCSEKRFQLQFRPEGERCAIKLELRNSRPGFFGRSSAEPKNAKEFVDFGVAVEEGGQFYHLC